MNKWLKRLLLFAIVIVIIIIFYKFYNCRKKGKESGKAYQCGFFSSEPTYLLPQEVYHIVREGKCYEVTDYGSKMSIREAEKEKCNEISNQ